MLDSINYWGSLYTIFSTLLTSVVILGVLLKYAERLFEKIKDIIEIFVFPRVLKKAKQGKWATAIQLNQL